MWRLSFTHSPRSGTWRRSARRCARRRSSWASGAGWRSRFGARTGRRARAPRLVPAPCVVCSAGPSSWRCCSPPEHLVPVLLPPPGAVRS
uniref:Uncharacterized protein n=1 Tax=Arundo donax TaxID=35708 RepID=A0A0A8ZWU3_ARUDO